MTWWEIGLRLLCAASFGALVGLERQWRARTAGLRTNALVCVGAALFELFSVLTPDAGSTTRIASYIVSGVGFLGAGVIIRDGGNLRGINTAATIWGTAGVGLMCGGGHYGVAAAGAVTIVIANLGLRPLARLVDGRATDPDLVETDYDLRAVCRDADEAHIRALVVRSVADGGFELRVLTSTDVVPDRVEVTARVLGRGAGGGKLERAVSSLSLQPGITSVSWRLVTHHPED
ncbi:MgtC/SapB family protein [Allokutzneria albata]|uniref:Putative Mg2+ transporter-C (MgtC) family protein n=1 Tax=Allokutzneria albata TaxID=211114 RepID=A0A1G9YHU4_ALLAB|nr:MgtC/SapB family protein [Allokutzneria albata]SDN08512.1 putative Mg2+ transporter-C (MgtC) family protein [Allokutzneria albata]